MASDLRPSDPGIIASGIAIGELESSISSYSTDMVSVLTVLEVIVVVSTEEKANRNLSIWLRGCRNCVSLPVLDFC
jgi:hypothetical protein